jgi:hypothetical protein
MKASTIIMLTAAIALLGNWAGGKTAGDLASGKIVKGAPTGSVLVGGLIAAVFLSLLDDAGGGAQKIGRGLAWMAFAAVFLTQGNTLLAKMGLVKSK